MVRARSVRYQFVRACPYCGKAMDPSLRSPHPKAPTRDHVLPKSRGGGWCVACCSSCNGHKADHTIREWHALLVEKDDIRAKLVEQFMIRHATILERLDRIDTGRVVPAEVELDDWRALIDEEVA